jgi:hypothetical protein
VTKKIDSTTPAILAAVNLRTTARFDLTLRQAGQDVMTVSALNAQVVNRTDVRVAGSDERYERLEFAVDRPTVTGLEDSSTGSAAAIGSFSVGATSSDLLDYDLRNEGAPTPRARTDVTVTVEASTATAAAWNQLSSATTSSAQIASGAVVYDMTNVRIRSLTISGDGQSLVTATYVLSPQTLTTTVGEDAFCWDFSTNARCR